MPVLDVVRVLVLALHRLLVRLLRHKKDELLTPNTTAPVCDSSPSCFQSSSPSNVLAPVLVFVLVLVLVLLLVLLPVLVRVYMLLHVRVGRCTCLCLLWCVCLCLRCTGCLCFCSTTRRTSC